MLSPVAARVLKTLIPLVFVLSLVSKLTLDSVPVKAGKAPPQAMADLAPDTDWSALFEAATGEPADGAHFGAYVFTAREDELFIGLGSARPAERNGALVAAFDGLEARAVGRLDEQGINEIITEPAGSLVIGGADPSYGDGWEMGTAYTSTGAAIRKNRELAGLLNVFHMWSLEAVGEGRIYASVSSHDGSFPNYCIYDVTCFGEIYASEDGGETWSRVSRLGGYRVYDIKEFGGHLYALYSDYHASDIRLGVSRDAGASWQQIPLPGADGRRTHLVEVAGRLVMLGGGEKSNRLYSIGGPDERVKKHNLPFSVGTLDADSPHFSQYKQFAVVGDSLYTTTREGEVMRSRGLKGWELVADSGSDLISIGYWPAQHKLLVGQRGPGARILTLDPCPESGRCGR